MERRALASAFDMEGGFNDVCLRLMPGVGGGSGDREPGPAAEPYGGLGAIPRRLQPSAWTLENELAQLQLVRLHHPR